MTFMNWIIDTLNYISDWFYELYIDCYYAGWPLEILDTWFYLLSKLFNDLAWDFSDFFSWLLTELQKLDQILSWKTIKSYILSWLPNLELVSGWFTAKYDWFLLQITTWWSATQLTVQSWVQGAKDFATSLFNQVNNALASLQTSWDSFKGKIPSIDAVLSWWGNWWGNILAQLGTWWNSRLLEVQDLINSAFTARDSLWAGWQEMRDNVVTFFSDPVEFIWRRFADWFLGPEV